MRVFIVSQYPAAKRGNQPENAMTKEEAKKKQLLAAYAWGRHSAAAPECFALDPDRLMALCAMGVMPPKVEKGAGSTPATGSAGNGVSVGEQPAATCVATTTNTKSDGAKAGARLRLAFDSFELVLLLSRLETEEETLERTGDNQSGDDAVEALSGLIHKARALVAEAEGRS